MVPTVSGVKRFKWGSFCCVAQRGSERRYVHRARTAGTATDIPQADEVTLGPCSGTVRNGAQFGRVSPASIKENGVIQPVVANCTEDPARALPPGAHRPAVHPPTDPVGRLLFNVLGMVAEFEADLIRMRTREGIAVAKAKGRLRGKTPKLSASQRRHLLELYDKGEHTQAELAEILPVSRTAIYREVQRRAIAAMQSPGNHEMTAVR